MVLGNPEMSKLRFNSVDIAEVNDYKYFGNVISPTRFPDQDPFRNTYQFLCDQARKAVEATTMIMLYSHAPRQCLSAI